MKGEILGGRYRLEREIGAGGMASVWRARDEVLGRPVAAKLLHSPLAGDPRAAERFRREAMLAAQISHPNMANVFDYVEEDGRPGIVMELVEGESLADRIARDGPLPHEEVVRIAGQVLAALEHAHTAGIVHRDVKPANILLQPGGGVKVADFGIARVAGDAALTQTGTVMGTAHYAAPEQIRGEPATAQSDLYALGAVMYEMLTGRRPFERETQVAVATARLTDDPVPTRAHRPEIPAAIEAVVMRALAREPRDRFATAAEMRAALRAPAHAPTSVMPVVGPDAAHTTALRTPAPVTTEAPTRHHAAGAGPRRARSRRRFSLLALVAVAAAFAGLLVATRGPGAVTVPDFGGMAFEEAEGRAGLLGLTVTRRDAPSGERKGTVVRQDIAAGTAVRTPAAIELRVSSGPRCCPVPDLTGMTADEATAALEDAGLTLGSRFSRMVTEGEQGRVIDQNPREGIISERGDPVDVTLADVVKGDDGRDDRKGRGRGNDDD